MDLVTLALDIDSFACCSLLIFSASSVVGRLSPRVILLRTADL